jgi:hypothetical protein
MSTPLTTPPPTTSPLDHPPTQFEREPFFDQTVSLLRCVRDHDLATLSELCDDDFGIVDIDPAGTARVVRTRTEWVAWFTELFATLDHLHAATDSEILDYHAVTSATMGYSVLEFRQFLTIGEHTATFDCITTIVWKHTPQGWREARWHGSVISSEIPPELMAAAA